MKRINILFLLTAGILLLAGCQKGMFNNPSGNEVRFAASSPQAQTKTVYGGYNDDATWQSIDWITGENADEILIWSDNAEHRDDSNVKSATYKISELKAGTTNEAYIVPAAGNGLVYTGADSYSFWSVYPATAPATTPTGKTISYSIGASQSPAAGDAVTEGTTVTLPADMSNAVMLAAVEGATEGDSPITLYFYPAFTAFEISIKGAAAMDDGEVIGLSSVTLVSGEELELAGDVTATLAPGKDGTSFVEGTAAPLVYTFPTNTALTKDGTLVFTVFARPLEVKGLKLKFTLADGQVRTASLYKKVEEGVDNTITFGACKKHRLYGLAMPDGFKMFASEAELKVADATPVDHNVLL